MTSMNYITIPFAGYRIECPNEEDLTHDLMVSSFEAADDQLNLIRKRYPNLTFELVVIVDA